MSAERRQQRRIPYRARVREVGPFAGESRTTNLSRGGLYLQRLSGSRLRKGDMLQLVVDLPVGSIRAQGYVVSEGEDVFYPCAAVAFIDVAPGDRGLLHEFVDGRKGFPPKGAILGKIPVEPAVC